MTDTEPNDGTESTRERVLTQIRALRDSKHPLSDSEWSLLLSLLQKLNLSRH
jgi:hypothetical protein